MTVTVLYYCRSIRQSVNQDSRALTLSLSSLGSCGAGAGATRTRLQGSAPQNADGPPPVTPMRTTTARPTSTRPPSRPRQSLPTTALNRPSAAVAASHNRNSLFNLVPASSLDRLASAQVQIHWIWPRIALATFLPNLSV
jgi:hypothetical protein